MRGKLLCHRPIGAAPLPAREPRFGPRDNFRDGPRREGPVMKQGAPHEACDSVPNITSFKVPWDAEIRISPVTIG